MLKSRKINMEIKDQLLSIIQTIKIVIFLTSSDNYFPSKQKLLNKDQKLIYKTDENTFLLASIKKLKSKKLKTCKNAK